MKMLTGMTLWWNAVQLAEWNAMFSLSGFQISALRTDFIYKRLRFCIE